MSGSVLALGRCEVLYSNIRYSLGFSNARASHALSVPYAGCSVSPVHIALTFSAQAGDNSFISIMRLPAQKQLGQHSLQVTGRLPVASAAASRRQRCCIVPQAAAVTDRVADSVAATEHSNGHSQNGHNGASHNGNGHAYGGGTRQNGDGTGPVILNGQVHSAFYVSFSVTIQSAA